jgi:hypothetical protein
MEIHGMHKAFLHPNQAHQLVIGEQDCKYYVLLNNEKTRNLYLTIMTSQHSYENLITETYSKFTQSLRNGLTNGVPHRTGKGKTLDRT